MKIPDFVVSPEFTEAVRSALGIREIVGVIRRPDILDVVKKTEPTEPPKGIFGDLVFSKPEPKATPTAIANGALAKLWIGKESYEVKSLTLALLPPAPAT